MAFVEDTMNFIAYNILYTSDFCCLDYIACIWIDSVWHTVDAQKRTIFSWQRTKQCKNKNDFKSIWCIPVNRDRASEWVSVWVIAKESDFGDAMKHS